MGNICVRPNQNQENISKDLDLNTNRDEEINCLSSNLCCYVCDTVKPLNTIIFPCGHRY